MNYFISYSQNHEDVLLWRALGHVKNGFYIDVGANDPVEHSVTKAFYDAGWSGISIEPLPSFHPAFEAQRPRDVNLAIAAGATEGELTLYDVPAVRGWASPEASVAEMHRAEGHEVAEITVPVRTLAAVCEEYVRGEIHFLKIDVEGFEGEVLRGMDFKRWRPWVLVIEATLPNSRETNHASWEHMVLGQGYRYAWFDGLNRYYVADEHAELLAQLDIQPNVFDGYVSHHLDKAWANEHALDAALGQAGEHARELTAVIEQVEAREQALHGHLERVGAQAQGLLDQLDKANVRLDQANARVDEANNRADHALLRVDEALHRAEYATGRAKEEAQRAGNAEAQNAVLTHELEQVHARAAQLTEWAKGMEAHIIAIQASTSWRVTRPLRGVGRVLHGLRRPHLLKRVVKRLTQVELLRRLIIPVLLRFPMLGRPVASQLAAIKQTFPDPLPPEVAPVPDELRRYPASVRTVLTDLQRVRNLHTGS
ncbi:FkbM family methyltransferase [Massilia aurea]|uniref:FkbM family methyltransferase n=1 Tax=Massilia aurea TaxID=373040 RepID=UPI0034624581